MEHKPLFVYGTLMPGGSNYDQYLRGATIADERATLPNAALFTDGQYPYLVLDARWLDPTDCVEGILITISTTKYAEVVQQIDWLEDYNLLSSRSMYQRIALPVTTPTGTQEAWTYLAGSWATEAIMAGRLRKLPRGVWQP